jgi:hypothetical protein
MKDNKHVQAILQEVLAQAQTKINGKRKSGEPGTET